MNCKAWWWKHHDETQWKWCIKGNGIMIKKDFWLNFQLRTKSKFWWFAPGDHYEFQQDNYQKHTPKQDLQSRLIVSVWNCRLKAWTMTHLNWLVHVANWTALLSMSPSEMSRTLVWTCWAIKGKSSAQPSSSGPTWRRARWRSETEARAQSVPVSTSPHSSFLFHGELFKQKWKKKHLSELYILKKPDTPQ